MSQAAAVLKGAAVEPAVAAILNAPIGSRQCQQPGRIGSLSTQAGHQPDHFGFVFRIVEIARAFQPGDLRCVRKVHLRGLDGAGDDRPPFTSSAVVFNLHVPRGEGTPEGASEPGVGGRVDCL